MASQAESSVAGTALTAPALKMLNDSRGVYLFASCGSVTGNFYFGLLSSKSDCKGSINCIFSKNSWLSPSEFESAGGKVRNRNWKKSLLHNHMSLQSCLSHLGACTLSSLQNSSQSSLSSHFVFSVSLVDPVLAFIKAHCCRGDRAALNRAVFSHFDTSKLLEH